MPTVSMRSSTEEEGMKAVASTASRKRSPGFQARAFVWLRILRCSRFVACLREEFG
jgi:hypothetical protein